jgi:tetratricopeptide (TPR) repeat protein
MIGLQPLNYLLSGLILLVLLSCSNKGAEMQDCKKAELFKTYDKTHNCDVLEGIEKSCDLKEEDSTYLQERFMCLLNRGRLGGLDTLIPFYSKIPVSPTKISCLAEYHFQRNNLKVTDQLYDSLFRMGYTTATWKYRQAFCNINWGNADKARKFLNEAIELDQEHECTGEIFFYYGMYYIMTKQFDSAIIVSNIALPKCTNGHCSGICVTKGFSFHFLNQPDSAIANYDKAVELALEGQKSVFFYERGRYLINIDKERACSDLNKAKEMRFAAAEELIKDFCK